MIEQYQAEGKADYVVTKLSDLESNLAAIPKGNRSGRSNCPENR